MSYEVDGEIHPPLDTFGHNRVFEVATVEEPVVARRLKFFKKGLPNGKDGKDYDDNIGINGDNDGDDFLWDTFDI